MSPVAARREAIIAAVDTYNRANPLVPLPRSAARLLAVMFTGDDTCQQSLDARLDASGVSPFLEVLEALLWGFHNSRDGRCFPSYESIAAKAECARSTVAEALKVLEWARVLIWQHRIARIQVRERDLFGHWASRWRVIRTSNAYVFRDPLARPAGVPASPSENRIGTRNQEVIPSSLPPLNPDSALGTALQRLGSSLGVGQEARLLLNKGGGTVSAI